MGWEPTDEFMNGAYEDVKAMVEGWKQDYGADDLACARLLITMARCTYWGDEPLEP